MPPPPPPPDFSLTLNPPAVSIPPGGTAQATLSLTALDGFSSSVSVQISDLPAGVTASASSYTVSAGAPQTIVLSATAYTPYPEYGAASAGGSTIVYAGSSGSEFGEQPSGPEYVWSYSAAADTFSGPAIFNDMPWLNAIPVVDGDGGVVGLTQGILDARRLPLVPIATPGAIAQLNGTGSLLYGVGFEGSQIVLSDTHNGRGTLMVQAQNTLGTVIGGYQPLAIDPTGTKILLGLQNGLAYFQLAVVPLAVGTVTPAIATPGGTIQVRGSGFVAGTTVKIGGQIAAL
jgi:hypothetical protein